MMAQNNETPIIGEAKVFKARKPVKPAQPATLATPISLPSARDEALFCVIGLIERVHYLERDLVAMKARLEAL